MLHFDRKGLAAGVAMLACAPAALAQADVQWQAPVKLSAPLDRFIEAHAGNTMIVAGSTGYSRTAVASVDLDTGAVRWKRAFERDVIPFATPDGGAVFATHTPYYYQTGVTRVDASGALVHSIPMPGNVGVIAVTPDGDYYARQRDSSVDLRILRIDGTTGQAEWGVDLRESMKLSRGDYRVGPDGDLFVVYEGETPVPNTSAYHRRWMRLDAITGARVFDVSTPMSGGSGTPLLSTAILDGGATLGMIAWEQTSTGTACVLRYADTTTGVATTAEANAGYCINSKPVFRTDGTVFVRGDVPLGDGTQSRAALLERDGTPRWERPAYAWIAVAGENLVATYSTDTVTGGYDVTAVRIERLDPATGATTATLVRDGFRSIGSPVRPLDDGDLLFIASKPNGRTRLERIRFGEAAPVMTFQSVDVPGPVDGTTQVAADGTVFHAYWRMDLDVGAPRASTAVLERVERLDGARPWRSESTAAAPSHALDFDIDAPADGGVAWTPSHYYDWEYNQRAGTDVGRVVHLDASGTERWRRSVGGLVYRAIATPTGGTFVALRDSGSPSVLEGLDAVTGAQRWLRSAAPVGGIPALLAHGDRAFLLLRTDDSSVQWIEKVDPATGAAEWRRSFPGYVGYVRVIGDGTGLLQAAYTDGVGAEFPVVVRGIAGASGETAWATTLAPIASFTRAPTMRVFDGAVYVGFAQKGTASQQQAVVARLDRETGAVMWQVPLPETAKGRLDYPTQLRMTPQGELAVVRNIKVGVVNEVAERTVVTRVSPATGDVSGTHVLTAANLYDTASAGRYPPSDIVGDIATDHMIVSAMLSDDTVAGTHALERVAWPAVFRRGDARLAATAARSADGVSTIDATLDYTGDASSRPITVDALPMDGTDSVTWTCTIEGTGSCSPTTGVAPGRAEVMLAPGSRARFAIVARRYTARPEAAGVHLAAYLPFEIGDANLADNALDASALVIEPPLLVDSFE